MQIAICYVNGDSGQWCESLTFWNLCFHSVCQRAWPRYEIQQCHCFIAPTAHTSCRQPSPVGLSYHCLMLHSRHSVPSQILFSITYGFVGWYLKQHCTFSFRMAI